MRASSGAKVALHDPTVYPVVDDVGEDLLQRLIAEMLRPLLETWLASQNVRALVGADQFIYWRQFYPTKSVAPDVYVLPGVAQDERVRAWKVWERDIVPSFTLEIVSSDEQKDVDESVRRYAEMGVTEVVIFDPEYHLRREGVRFRVHRMLPRRGLTLIEATNADRVRSKVLRCWLRAVGEGTEVRLRVATGPRGDELLPTDAERARLEAERARVEAERARVEAERAAAEREARIAAEAELAKVKAELAKAVRATRRAKKR
jgi:Uma2 family endonuclease